MLASPGAPQVTTITRPEILFHELAHVEMDGDPLPRFPGLGSALPYPAREAIIISRENAFRRSQNPRLGASQMRSTVNLTITHPF